MEIHSGKPLYKCVFEHRSIYLMLLPAVVWYAVFCYYPMYGILIAFKDYKFNMGIIGSPWVGMKYFSQFLFTDEFWGIMRNTVVISGLKLLFCFPAPIILALLLNELSQMRFKRMVQTFSYLPNFVSWTVLYALMVILFTPYGGIINNIREHAFGLEPVFFLGEKSAFYPITVISDIWKGVGWGSIIYLGAITGINPELYEAATCDGAGRFRCAWHVTMPGILPTVGILFIMSVGGIFGGNIDQILLLQQPSNLDLSEFLGTYILKVGILQGRFGFATAVGLFNSVLSACLVFLANWISKHTTGISIW